MQALFSFLVLGDTSRVSGANQEDDDNEEEEEEEASFELIGKKKTKKNQCNLQTP